ncbi:OsmC family protein [Hydrogenophaga sp.]|uniref:OsmC family protein n=1 Tax=Hydrogenophaga sp. TaxID=1904254 RepID=UPI002FCAA520
MDAQDHIRNAFSRMAHVFAKKPEAAQDTSVMRARVVEGLHCEAQEGDWRFSIDMPVEGGGIGAGPTPGVHGRAALASCLAIGYSIFLARAGIGVRSLEVEVAADYDNRGLLGMEGVYPAYLGVRHTLYLEADATPEQLEPVLAEARRCSPYLHVFADPQPLQGSVVYGPRG